MTERPILFSAPMVRAILEDRKTQTRRTVKLPRWAQECNEDHEFEMDGSPEWPHTVSRRTGCLAPIECPYGALGDRLWVREAHEFIGDGKILYKADGAEVLLRDPQPYRPRVFRGRPGMYLPRWASRITLEVVAVRVERLQDISQDDAVAEGCDDIRDGNPKPGRIMYAGGPRVAFAVLWDSINAKRAPWASNPWVWVIEFRRGA